MPSPLDMASTMKPQSFFPEKSPMGRLFAYLFQLIDYNIYPISNLYSQLSLSRISSGIKETFPFLESKEDFLAYLFDFSFPSAKQCKNVSARLNRMIRGEKPVKNRGGGENLVDRLIQDGAFIIFCYPPAKAYFEYFLIGLPVMGMVSHILHYYRVYVIYLAHMRDPNNNRAFQDQGGWLGLVNMSFIWISSDISFTIRLSSIFGILTFLKNLYSDLSSNLRYWSNEYLGKEIMNAHENIHYQKARQEQQQSQPGEHKAALML
jgi:hypothetical protein